MKKTRLKLPEIVTDRFLRKIRVCEEELAVFRKLWPRGCRITEANIYKALENDLNVSWFCCKISEVLGLVSRECRDAFMGNLRDLDRVQASIFDELWKRKKDKSFGVHVRAVAVQRRRGWKKEAKLEFALLKEAQKGKTLRWPKS